MKKVTLLLILILSSCELQNSIIIWNAKDIIGTIIGLSAFTLIGIAYLIAKLLDWNRERKNKRNENR